MLEVESAAFQQTGHALQLGLIGVADHVLHVQKVVSDAFRRDVSLLDGITREAAEHGGLAEQVLLLGEGHLPVSIHVQDGEHRGSLLAFLVPRFAQSLVFHSFFFRFLFFFWYSFGRATKPPYAFSAHVTLSLQIVHHEF